MCPDMALMCVAQKQVEIRMWTAADVIALKARTGNPALPPVPGDDSVMSDAGPVTPASGQVRLVFCQAR
jgi:hypothetical protein